MPEDSSASQVAGEGSAQEANGQSSQVATTERTQGAAGEQQGSGEQQTQTRQPRSETERLRQEAEAARQEAARYRTQLRTFEQRDMTETQRLQSSYQELETNHRTTQQQLETSQAQIRTLRATIALTQQGATAPDLLAPRLTDDDLASDESLKAAVKELKKSYPQLFQRASGNIDGASENAAASRPGSNMNNMIRARMQGEPVSQG